MFCIELVKVFKPDTSDCSDPVINPKLIICKDDEIVPAEVTEPPEPKPNDAADAEVIYPKSDICVDPDIVPSTADVKNDPVTLLI